MSEIEFARATLMFGCVTIVTGLVLIYIVRQMLREVHGKLDRVEERRKEVEALLDEADRKVSILEAYSKM